MNSWTSTKPKCMWCGRDTHTFLDENNYPLCPSYMDFLEGRQKRELEARQENPLATWLFCVAVVLVVIGVSLWVKR